MSVSSAGGFACRTNTRLVENGVPTVAAIVSVTAFLCVSSRMVGTCSDSAEVFDINFGKVAYIRELLRLLENERPRERLVVFLTNVNVASQRYRIVNDGVASFQRSEMIR